MNLLVWVEVMNLERAFRPASDTHLLPKELAASLSAPAALILPLLLAGRQRH